tara:strand:- start:9 stop:269 length:261 start_codon:yes stop_codon:yes gene_type:complete
MSHHIDKTQAERWFCAEISVDIIKVFGHANLGSILDTGQPNLETYLTEDELEAYVDSVLGTNYYVIAVTTGNDIFMGTSGKYPMPE